MSGGGAPGPLQSIVPIQPAVQNNENAAVPSALFCMYLFCLRKIKELWDTKFGFSTPDNSPLSRQFISKIGN